MASIHPHLSPKKKKPRRALNNMKVVNNLRLPECIDARLMRLAQDREFVLCTGCLKALANLVWTRRDDRIVTSCADATNRSSRQRSSTGRAIRTPALIGDECA
jgi:hypothetical protein